MKSKIFFSTESVRDLDEVKQYITIETGDEEIAVNNILSILSSIDRLEDFPELGVEVNQIAKIKLKYRYLIINDYMVFYRINGNEIYVDRILHGKRDYLRILFG